MNSGLIILIVLTMFWYFYKPHPILNLDESINQFSNSTTCNVTQLEAFSEIAPKLQPIYAYNHFDQDLFTHQNIL